MTVVSYQYYKT